MENLEESKKFRTEVEQYISDLRSQSNVLATGRDNDTNTNIFKGCCYLTKGMVKEHFNDFTESECRSAASSCGCLYTFAPGKSC